MAKKLDEIRFKSSPTDPDVWMKPAVKPDGEEYYEYVLMYVDDILAISMDPISIPMSMEGNTVKCIRMVRLSPQRCTWVQNCKKRKSI